ncbi:SurA N-terminal domain-containing protein [Candidatus Omnitrophota bacterium]
MVLKFLRKKKHMKRIIWGLAILIIPAFVLWGAGSASRKKGKGPNYAGKVFNRKVSFDEYLDMWRVSRDYAINTFGNKVPPEFIDELSWNRVILLEGAKKESITVKDDEVVWNIISFPIFQRDGSFDKKLYKSMLGEGVRGFEEKLRDDIRIAKLRAKITYDIFITDEEVKEEYKKQFEKIKASYIPIPFAGSREGIQYEEGNLTEHYENNKESFIKPDHINLKYIEILFSRFEDEVQIEEEAITRYFEEHMADFEKQDSEETPLLDDEIRKTINDLLSSKRKTAIAEEVAYRALDDVLEEKDLDKTGASFSLEIKETGFFNMQQEIPGIGWSYELAKKGFELAPEEISNTLTKTDKGFYIIQLKENKESYIPELAEVKDDVIESYIKSRSMELSKGIAEETLSNIKDKMRDGMSFKNAATEFNLEIKETDFINRSGYIPGLGPAKDFADIAFSLEKTAIGGPVKMQENWAILKPDGYEEIDEVKFIEEKESFKEELLSNKKNTAFDEWFEDLKKEANFVSYTSE